MLVAVDYLTKWIEARPLREISASEVERFTWKHLICRYGLHYAIVIDNSTQFKAYTYEEFLTRLGVKHLVTSIEHPQTNDQAKAANKVILRTLCIRPDKSKGLWKEELPSILWAYHCSPQTTTSKTLFLIYIQHKRHDPRQSRGIVDKGGFFSKNTRMKKTQGWN